MYSEAIGIDWHVQLDAGDLQLPAKLRVLLPSAAEHHLLSLAGEEGPGKANGVALLGAELPRRKAGARMIDGIDATAYALG